MKNCYTWAKDQIASHGGRWVLAWSDRWFLHFHMVYVREDGTMWGYEPDDRRYFPMWRFIVDARWTFEGHTTEYEVCVRFIDGLEAAIMMELLAMKTALRTLAAKITSFTQGG